ncbi:MAG TPA: transcription-repair coupling factor, partial [Ferruginibacter sp.]|nr:transcription-repair coupling factor [Ferruginibacter sp.]
MNLETLLQEYAHDRRCFSIADRITASQPQATALKGLQGSAAPFIVSAIFNHPAASQLNHIVVLRDAEEAAYFHNSLENISGALNLFYFPSSFKNKKNFRLLNPSHVMLRTECLTRFSNPLGNNRVGAVITYPEALFEKVVLPKAIASSIISIKQGDTIDPNGIYEKLVGYGFNRTDFVYEPGQFAVRGGILDIYSYGNEKPYRVELFGNEVDSIRIFDPETQLSERKLLQVNIIPNVETLPKAFGIEDGDKVSLLEFLPENTVVWTEDWEFIKGKIAIQEEEFRVWSSTAEVPKDP